MYWAGISIDNYVLLQGIGALIKSDMLASHYEFPEEATVSAFIAMEASFQSIVRKLGMEGVSEPGARDAVRWLFEHFDKPLGFAEPVVERYFAEFYD